MEGGDGSESVVELQAEVVGPVALSFSKSLTLTFSLSSPSSTGLGLGSLEKRRKGKVTLEVVVGNVECLGWSSDASSRDMSELEEERRASSDGDFHVDAGWLLMKRSARRCERVMNLLQASLHQNVVLLNKTRQEIMEVKCHTLQGMNYMCTE